MCKRLLPLVLLLLMCVARPSVGSEIAEEFQELERDIAESQNLVKEGPRFVPVPIPISNPTVGTGLAVAGLYLHPQREEDPTLPTSISGVHTMYTDTQSWTIGVFHEGFYSQDAYRVRGLLGYGELNLKFYGIGNDSILRDRPVEYEARTTIFSPRLLFRLPVKNWFVGARYLYLEIDNTFDPSNLLPGLPEIEITTKTAGLGLVGVYDSRNNNLWPTAGSWFEFTATDYGEYVGGDFDYRKYILKFSQYHQVVDKITFAYRLDGQFIGGDAPFYDLASLKLRGFPYGRYADKNALSVQGELRWNFKERWTALVFGGGGRIAEEINDLGSAPTNSAGGVGIRYMIAREKKLNIGVDITYGDGEYGFYVQIGDAFAN
jgi:hypothetical protein